MPAPFLERDSIAYIVPSLNEESVVEATLKRIQSLSGPKEIILADGGSSDATVSLANALGCEVTSSEPGRGIQMNRGASVARSRLLCFIHADTLLPTDAAEEIRTLLSDPSVIAGSFRLSFDTAGRRLAFYARCSAINSTLFTYGDQGLFLRRETFQQIDGYRTYPFLEDVEIQRRLRKRGRFAKSRHCVTTSARRFMAHGPLKQQVVNLAIVTGYYLGFSPKRLHRFYRHLR